MQQIVYTALPKSLSPLVHVCSMCCNCKNNNNNNSCRQHVAAADGAKQQFVCLAQLGLIQVDLVSGIAFLFEFVADFVCFEVVVDSFIFLFLFFSLLDHFCNYACNISIEQLQEETEYGRDRGTDGGGVSDSSGPDFINSWGETQDAA